MEIDRELLLAFMDDYDEQIQIMENDLVTLERSGSSPDLISEIFRAAHTIKGSSAMAGFGVIEQLSHSMESLLAGIRDGRISITDPVVTVLFAGVDALRRLRELLPHIESNEESITALAAKIDDLAAAAETSSQTPAENKAAELVEPAPESPPGIRCFANRFGRHSFARCRRGYRYRLPGGHVFYSRRARGAAPLRFDRGGNGARQFSDRRGY